MDSQLKISFCIPCMGRLHHLKETLPNNIEKSNNYNVEFIVLNYNSADKLDEWMKDNMMDHIETGKIVYYKTIEPEYFKMSHSKNMANRLGTGDLLFTLDADIFILQDICRYCNEVFQEDRLLVDRNCGSICLFADFFHKARGYDESMIGWGQEDKDFHDRCTKFLGMHGGKCFPNMFHTIEHSNDERVLYLNPKFKYRRGTNRHNKNIKENRTEESLKEINKDGYGCGIVYKNFSNIPIVL